ncbi:MAG: hypothetical protein KGH65_04025 [Candidatus Micrarchaeota archaeon]|nr:hypothetical protein [Candidatus Micrarchaeota archaeon]
MPGHKQKREIIPSELKDAIRNRTTYFQDAQFFKDFGESLARDLKFEVHVEPYFTVSGLAANVFLLDREAKSEYSLCKIEQPREGPEDYLVKITLNNPLTLTKSNNVEGRIRSAFKEAGKTPKVSFVGPALLFR